MYLIIAGGGNVGYYLTKTLINEGYEVLIIERHRHNLVICQMAKRKFDVPRAIARINNPKNEEIFRRLGIDVTVSQTNVILALIEQLIPDRPMVHLMTLKHADDYSGD